MFKFDFEIDDIDEEQIDTTSSPSESNKVDASSTREEKLLEPFKRVPLAKLLAALPLICSYSPLSISLSEGSRVLTLVRRDLFDARFQVIAEDRGDQDERDEICIGSRTSPPPEWNSNENETSDLISPSTVSFLDTPSDIVPGVYEGGLKTWECSLDLVQYLDSIKGGSGLCFGGVTGKKIIELGCGTAVPTLYLLRELFYAPLPELSSPLEASKATYETYIHLQDYNPAVLALVTLPNIILTWYHSPASLSFRLSLSPPIPDLSPDEPGELPITPELVSAFLEALHSYRVSIAFFSGAWEGFNLHHATDLALTDSQLVTSYDIVLTSETIYRPESLEVLVSVLERACGRGTSQFPLMEKLSISDPEVSQRPYLCLVAAKVLYFGVGGGVAEFMKTVEGAVQSKGGGLGRGKVDVVWELGTGVRRRIMRVNWL